MRRVSMSCVLMLPAIVAGCATAAYDKRTGTEQADWPVLQPVEEITPTPPSDMDPTARIEARAALLRARAAVLAATDI